MSRVKLYRRTLSVTGMTPSEFIRLIRLRHAEQLLVKSQLSISEIAYNTGFSSQRYFSKCFKELYGCIPSEYKNRKKYTAVQKAVFHVAKDGLLQCERRPIGVQLAAFHVVS